MESLDDDLLADVDAWLRGLEAFELPQAPASASCASSSSSEAPTGDSKRLRPGRPRGKRMPRLSQLRPEPMNSTQRRKEELAFLRLHVVELEGELASLRRHRWPGDGRRGRVGGEERSAWRSLAKHQRVERARAERENASLLKELQEHIKLTRAVKKLLSKGEEDSKQKQAVVSSPSAGCHTRSEEVKLRQILQSVETQHPLLHVVLQPNLEIEDGGYVKLNNALSGGISMEMRHCRVLPFSCNVVGSTARTAVQQGKLNYFPDVTVVDSTADSAMLKLKVLLPPVLVTPATVYQAIRWFHEPDVEYSVSEMRTSTSGTSTNTFPPLDVILRSWTSIRSATMPDGSLGSEIHEFVTLTALETSGQSTTYNVRSLSEFIASVYQEKHQFVHQTLENMLMDALPTAST